MSFGERRVWLEGYVQVLHVKRPCTEVVRKRSSSLWYTLPQADGIKLTVCKRMFLNTLGLKTDGMITEFQRAKESTQTSVIQDCRGRSAPPNKVQHDVIHEHINSYHPAVSHYNLAHTPNRRFLEPHLTITGNIYFDLATVLKICVEILEICSCLVACNIPFVCSGFQLHNSDVVNFSSF